MADQKRLKVIWSLGVHKLIKSTVEAGGISILPRLTVAQGIRARTLKGVNILEVTIKRNLWLVKEARDLITQELLIFEE